MPLFVSLYQLQIPSNAAYEYHVFVFTRYVLDDLYGHHKVVIQIHKKESTLGRGLLFKGTKYILVSWLLF
jgi:hypothetical protein